MPTSSNAPLAMDPESLSVRPATAADNDFLLEVYKSSRGDDLRSLDWTEERIHEFLEMQYEAHRKLIEHDYLNMREDIICYDGERIGSAVVDQRADEIRCLDVALLPQYRNRGLGAFFLRKLQKEAGERACALRLQVLQYNRAVSFFERLGFVRVSETGTHVQMEWNRTSKVEP